MKFEQGLSNMPTPDAPEREIATPVNDAQLQMLLTHPDYLSVHGDNPVRRAVARYYAENFPGQVDRGGYSAKEAAYRKGQG